jgi:hypothetical protein
MSVNAPITSVDCRTEARSHTHRTFPDGFVTFIRFTFRAREGIVTLSLGGHLGTRMSRTFERLVSCGDGSARSGWGACRATSSWSMFILESRHTRTLDGPGKASPGHARGEQFAKLTRAANAERWPEQLEA